MKLRDKEKEVPKMTDEDSWNVWSKHIILELKRFSESITKMDEKLDTIKNELATIKIKVGIIVVLGFTAFEVVKWTILR